MPEAREAAHALAQREFKRWDRSQFVAQTEQFQRVAARPISDVPSLAETVLEGDAHGCGRGHNCRVHTDLVLIGLGMRELCRFRD